MTYFQIIRKQVKTQINSYKLYFLCNALVIAIFCCYATVFKNPIFMNRKIIDYSISSKITVTSHIIAIFLLCFVPYSFHAFLKTQKYNYGVMMSIGMDIKQIIFSILIENACIVSFSLFLFLFSLIYARSNKINERRDAYDLEYCQVNNQVNQADISKVEELLKENGISVTEHYELRYLNSGDVNILPVSEVNQTFHKQFTVPEGKMLNLFLYDSMKEVSRRRLDVLKKRVFTFNKESLQLESCGNKAEKLLDRNRAMADYTIIVHDKDFDTIKTNGKMAYVGKIQMFQFDHWKKSLLAVTRLQKYLTETNDFAAPGEESYFKISSQIADYNQKIQETKLCIVTLGSIGLLFYFVSILLLYYKLRDEEVETKQVMNSLFRMGMTENELETVIRRRNIYVVIPQLGIAILITAGIYVGMVPSISYDFKLESYTGVLYSLAAGVILMVCQYMFCASYTKKQLSRCYK